MPALRAIAYLWILNAAPQLAQPQGVKGDDTPGQLCSEQQRLAEGRVAAGSEEMSAVLAQYSRLVADPSLSKPPVSNSTVSHFEEECAGLLFSARAAALAVSGRMADAELDAERSLAILEKRYPGDHPILFRVLHTLAIARFELGKTRTAWQAYRRLALVRSEGPQDRALVHATAAWLLHSQRKFPEAVAEYGNALRDMDEARLGSSADSAALRVSRARAFVDERQFDSAQQELDRATEILSTASGVVPMDRIVLQQARGRLHARRREWLEAEQDMRAAFELADREGAQSAVTESTLLEYGVVLRKVHRNAEARTMVARAAGLRSQMRSAVVDVAELSLSSTPRKKK
jgi:hypothetical protein